MQKPNDPLPIEETNLAGIGSDEDKKARAAAAKLDFHWEGAGQKVGVEIWRVENRRDQYDNPDFGIEVWPKAKYGKFYRGDSYIVMRTSKDEGGDKLVWDIYFWIGSESSQDEYGVAAYKANELDDLLGDAPVQYREVEGQESEEFLECFPNGVTYLRGGVQSGFRKATDSINNDNNDFTKRLFRVRKAPGRHQSVRCFEVPLELASIDDGDAFVLDAGHKIYTWFGSTANPFERNKSAIAAHNLQNNTDRSPGFCDIVSDVGEDDDGFWQLLGGKGPIPEARVELDPPTAKDNKMYLVSDDYGIVKVAEVPLSKSNLISGNVCLVDDGNNVFVWIGKEASEAEKQQGMAVVNRYLKSMGRTRTTSVSRVMQGQEYRCRSFRNAF